MRDKIAGWAGLLGVLFFVGEAIIGGLQFERYSHVRQFISETYASGTPWSDALRFGVVLPAGVLFTVFAFLSASTLRAPRRGMIGFIAFGVFYGLGTVATAFFPCDLGCDPGQVDPTISHILHFVSGTLTYLFTPFCLVLLGAAANKWPNVTALPKTLLACGAIMFAGVLVLFLFPMDGLLGLNQRIIEGAALVSIVRCSLYLLSAKCPWSLCSSLRPERKAFDFQRASKLRKRTGPHAMQRKNFTFAACGQGLQRCDPCALQRSARWCAQIRHPAVFGRAHGLAYRTSRAIAALDVAMTVGTGA